MSCCGSKPKSREHKFNADYNKKPLTHKFWSKHDHNYLKSINVANVMHHEKEIEKRQNYDARCHSKMPQYANQTYGWLPGYKLSFLQHCDVQIYGNAAIQKATRDLFTSKAEKH